MVLAGERDYLPRFWVWVLYQEMAWSSFSGVRSGKRVLVKYSWV